LKILAGHAVVDADLGENCNFSVLIKLLIVIAYLV